MIRLIKNVPAVPLYCHNINKYLRLLEIYFRRFKCSAIMHSWTIKKQMAYNKLVQVIYGCDKNGVIIPFNGDPPE